MLMSVLGVLFVLWAIAFPVICYGLADRKGYEGLTASFWGFLFGPIAVFVYAKLPSKKQPIDGTNKPNNSPKQQEIKRKAQKTLLPAGLLWIVGFVLGLLASLLDFSNTVIIVMNTAWGLCWGIAVALWLPVYLSQVQMRRGKGEPSEEQALKNKTKIKRLQIAAIVFFTALMLVCSLCIFR